MKTGRNTTSELYGLHIKINNRIHNTPFGSSCFRNEAGAAFCCFQKNISAPIKTPSPIPNSVKWYSSVDMAPNRSHRQRKNKKFFSQPYIFRLPVIYRQSGSERLASLRSENDGAALLPDLSSQASFASREEANDDELLPT
jgi:hypothetical protein